MAFNSADTAAFKNVWVFCEQRQGVMMPTTFELISEGRKLANELGIGVEASSWPPPSDVAPYR